MRLTVSQLRRIIRETVEEVQDLREEDDALAPDYLDKNINLLSAAAIVFGKEKGVDPSEFEKPGPLKSEFIKFAREFDKKVASQPMPKARGLFGRVPPKG